MILNNQADSRNHSSFIPDKRTLLIEHINASKEAKLRRDYVFADLVPDVSLIPDFSVPELSEPRQLGSHKPVFVDTISLTGKFDYLHCDDYFFTDDLRVNWINARLNAYLGFSLGVENAGKRNLFQQSRAIQYSDGRPQKQLGFLAWGGASQRGSFQIYLTGEAFEYINATGAAERLYAFAVLLGLKITRIDIAWDDLLGKYPIERIFSMHRAGDFRITRNPDISQQGTPLGLPDKKGRTFYIGSRKGGKLLRSYEKGKQLGDPLSPWMRHELELKSKDRVIPLEAILKPHQYYAGAFPALESFGLSTVAQSIATIKRKAKVSIQKTKDNIKRQFGRALGVLSQLQSPVDLLAELSVEGVPPSLIFPVPVPSIGVVVDDPISTDVFGLLDTC